MFEGLSLGAVIWWMLTDDLEVFLRNVELWKIVRIRLKFMKIININFVEVEAPKKFWSSSTQSSKCNDLLLM